MAKHAYQNHNGISIKRPRTYADASQTANLNNAIIHLRNAKDARNSILFNKELLAAINLARNVWIDENN